MVSVVIVVAVLVVLALIAIGAWVVNRREGDEVHSIEGYRHTLDTLQGIRTKSTSASVRVLGGPADSPSAPAAGGGDGGAEEGTNGTTPPTPGRPIGRGGEVVFEDPALSAPSPAPMSFGRRDRAMSAMNHRPRRLAAPILVGVVVLVVLGLVILVGVHSQTPHKASGPTPTTASPPASNGAASPGAGSPTTAPHQKAKGHRAPPATTTPTTKPPANFTAVTSSATTATYKPPAASYSLTLSTPNGECWVDVASGGTTVFTKTMLAGQQQSLNATGTTTIVLGAPGAVTVQLDHLPVVLPANYQSPFTLTLSP